MGEEAEVRFECVVSADLFARAQIVVLKDEVRYYLHGVHVSPAPEGGAILTATDGAMLVSLRDPDAYVSGEGIVQLERPMLAAMSASGVLLERRLLAVKVAPDWRSKAFVLDQPRGPADDNDYSPHLAARDVFCDPDKRVRAAQFSTCLIDGTFPDWRRALPDRLRPDAAMPLFDMERMARLSKALNDKHDGRLIVTPTGEAPEISPLLVAPYSGGLRQGFGILMPIICDRKQASVPTWARPPETAKAA
jgi:hypothetical protein